MDVSAWCRALSSSTEGGVMTSSMSPPHSTICSPPSSSHAVLCPGCEGSGLVVPTSVLQKDHKYCSSLQWVMWKKCAQENAKTHKHSSHQLPKANKVYNVYSEHEIKFCIVILHLHGDSEGAWCLALANSSASSCRWASSSLDGITTRLLALLLAAQYIRIAIHN